MIAFASGWERRVGEGGDTFFFLSHRSTDKPRLRKFVVRLLDAGIPLWIDVAEKVVDDPRLDRGAAIRYGEAWADEIERAMVQSGSYVLFCWSDRAAAAFRPGAVTRGGLQWELEQGLARRRLIGVRLDKTPLNRLPEEARALHWADLSELKTGVPNKTFDRLVEEMRFRIEEGYALKARFVQNAASSKLRAYDTQQPTESLDRSFAVYTVDRTDAFEESLDALEAAKRGGATIKPLIVIAPDDEAPDMFLERCWRAERQHWHDRSQTTRVDWVREGDFADAYRRKLSFALFKRSSASIEEIAERLRDEGRAGSVRALVSFLEGNAFTKHDPRRIADWIAFWRTLEQGSGGVMKTLPVLCVWLASANRPWTKYPPTPRGQAVKNEAICRALAAASGEVHLAGPLEPFSREQARHWREDVRQRLGGSTPAAHSVARTFDNLFQRRGKSHRVSMKTFAEAMSAVLAHGE